MTLTIPETSLSVCELTLYLKDLLESDRHLQQVWVIGEVVSSNNNTSGLFFTLSDPEVDASIRCVVWNSNRSRLVQSPQPGEQLLVLGSVRLYPKRGEYQLTVVQALPAGEGLQALRYQQLRSRLQAEGLFAASRKRPLPIHPQTIAVVTSPSAAAWGDIQRTLKQRYPGLTVLLSPAIVQGEQAPLSLVTAIERIKQDGRAEVLIVARGGGAVEDLSCFNDERVVRAIAQSSIPVITGIGHQRDESLADLVADYSTHTPTAAAEIVVPSLAELYLAHQQRLQKLTAILTRRITKEEESLQKLRTHLKNLPITSQALQKATTQCQILAEKLIALNPEAVLQRGYTVVKSGDGNLVKSRQGLCLNEELLIQFGDGVVKVKVIDL